MDLKESQVKVQAELDKLTPSALVVYELITEAIRLSFRLSADIGYEEVIEGLRAAKFVADLSQAEVLEAIAEKSASN